MLQPNLIDLPTTRNGEGLKNDVPKHRKFPSSAQLTQICLLQNVINNKKTLSTVIVYFLPSPLSMLDWLANQYVTIFLFVSSCKAHRGYYPSLSFFALDTAEVQGSLDYHSFESFELEITKLTLSHIHSHIRNNFDFCI